MRAHVDDAFQAELGADRGRGHAVLTGAGFRDDAGLAHAAGEDDLAQHVVDLVRTGVVQLVALHVDLRPAQPLGQPLREIERRGSADVVGPEVVHLVPERLVGLRLLVFRLEFEDERHQGFRDEPPAEVAETALLVGAGHVAVDQIFGHGACSSAGPPGVAAVAGGSKRAGSFRNLPEHASGRTARGQEPPDTAFRNAAMRTSSLRPGAVSTPEETSTCRAPVSRTASATFSGVSPPASIHGTGQRRPAISRQSKESPLPPGSAAPSGGFASTRSWSATRPKASSAARSAAPATPTAFITGRP